MSTRIYTEIVGQREEFDLFPDTTIAITKQINDIGELENVQSDFTNSFTLPLTTKNARLLGNPHLLNSLGSKEYQSISVTLEVDGFQIMPFGRLIITEVNQGTSIRCSIYSGMFNFFEAIEKLGLFDLDLSEWDHDFDVATIALSTTRNSGYSWPYVQYGALVAGGASQTYNINQQYPAAFIYSLISKIVTEQGYILGGYFTNDSFYQSLLMPFTGQKFEHSDRLIGRLTFEYSLLTQQTFAKSGVIGATGVGPTYTFNLGYIPLSPSNEWTAGATGTIDIEVSVTVSNFTAILNDAGDAINGRIDIVANGVTQLGTVNVTTNGTVTISTTSSSVTSGDTLGLVCYAVMTTTTGPGPDISFKVSSAQFYTGAADRTISVGDEITMESYLANWPQKKLLKGVFNLFGIMPEIDPFAKIVWFRRFQDIVDSSDEVNWSDKLVPVGDSLYDSKTTKIGVYAQNNTLSYKPDAFVNTGFADGNISISHEGLDPERNLFTLPWAASETTDLSIPDQRVAVIPLLNEDSGGGFEIANRVEPRIIYREFATGTTTISDGTTTSIHASMAWGRFIDPQGSQNLGFGNSLLSDNYSGLQQVLKSPLKVVAWFNLSPVDIKELDHFKPVRVDQFGARFYVNKVINYINGQPTKVELIRLGVD